MPWLQRVAVLVLVPFFAFGLRVFGRRRMLARYLAAEDLPTVEGHAVRKAFPAVTKFIVDDRDRLLASALAAIVAARAGEAIVVAVVSGLATWPRSSGNSPGTGTGRGELIG